MILEVVVTTVSREGTLNIAPMGLTVVDAGYFFRPYRTAQTYKNLKAHGQGVFHITDDVLLLAQTAIGQAEPAPEVVPARQVQGSILKDACRYHEFLVASLDDREERTLIKIEVVHSATLRDFIGFNRAKNAVLEAAILATRTDFLPLDEIDAEFRKLAVIVAKTGDDAEHRAFALLRSHLDRVACSRNLVLGSQRQVS